MARQQKQPEPKEANLSLQQMKVAIPKIDRRIAEVRRDQDLIKENGKWQKIAQKRESNFSHKRSLSHDEVWGNGKTR